MSQAATTANYYFNVAAYADTSWVKFIPEALISACRRSSIGQRMISRILIDRLKLPPPVSLEISSEHHWVLLTAAQVKVLARRVGTLAIAFQLRSIVAREKVQTIKRLLGDELYKDAIDSKQVIVNENIDYINITGDIDEKILNRIDYIGAQLLISSLPSDNPALYRRASLFFDRQCLDKTIIYKNNNINIESINRIIQSIMQGDQK